jgi:chorismate dehydratase
VPLEDVEFLLMDYQSRTSVALAKLLLAEYWKLSPEIIPTQDDYRMRIKGNTAGLVIGDRALEQRSRSKYIYDLGSAWKKHTGLPFVFAAWVSREKLEPAFVSAFNEANRFGLTRIEEVVAEQHFPPYDLLKYYTSNVSYNLTVQKLEAISLFLQSIVQPAI